MLEAWVVGRVGGVGAIGAARGGLEAQRSGAPGGARLAPGAPGGPPGVLALDLPMGCRNVLDLLISEAIWPVGKGD